MTDLAPQDAAAQEAAMAEESAALSAAEDARAAATEQEMIAQGITPYAVVQADYFGVDENYKVMLPDGASFIEFKTMTEGGRVAYAKVLNRPIRIQKATQDAHFTPPSGEEKGALVAALAVGWNLRNAAGPVPFTSANMRKFLDGGNPKMIDGLYKELVKRNPILENEITVEDIDAEIESLQQRREALVAEQEGKETS